MADYIRAPWRLVWGDRTVGAPRIVDADGNPVVAFGNQARHQGRTKTHARASLMSVAPELLGGCEYALANFEAEWQAVGNHPASHYGDDVDYYRALIAKAKAAP